MAQSFCSLVLNTERDRKLGAINKKERKTNLTVCCNFQTSHLRGTRLRRLNGSLGGDKKVGAEVSPVL